MASVKIPSMIMDHLKPLLEANEFGLYKLSEVNNVAIHGDSSVICYTLVGAEPHRAHEVVYRVAILYDGRITHSLLVK